ncbi:hypothetical protein BT63DRAFT_477489 [Microthyrium microscopicum]|uniref:C2H2-type domain-containing protein n=1 Tax=Microthyrium microscopicum TaxID=703497 RepID=A0A6A6UIL7_9PEZI|nr:hypothetical protein BT63DRAFT_477489 [Microthyrium microscopicum]
MLSQPTSAIETRRRAHRRQNSTPNIEVGQLRKAPAAAGIQRANSHRGHRRGLSLDQPRLYQPSKLTPTLGPISQDDISVSTNHSNHTNHAGQPLQYHHTAVTQPSLAQPGHHHQFQHQFHPQGLGLQTQDFPPHMQYHLSHENHSPHSSTPNPHFGHGPISAPPLTPAQQLSAQPTQQQIDELERHIKSVYGSIAEVHINILPTPVATPQKRASLAAGDNVDVSPIPLQFDNTELALDPLFDRQDLKFDPQTIENERAYESSFYSSPSHSTSCSPTAPSIKSFIPVENITPSFALNDSMIFSSQTTLTDVEAPFHHDHDHDSPSHSPRAVSIADLNIDGGTIEETGISQEEIQNYISSQDPLTHRWTCLFPGCDAKTFGRRENIRSHVQTHLGDRQYRCNHCGKCFVRQHDLKRHAKIHTGNKPYRCPCGGGFARQDALTRHRQRGMCVGAFPDAVRKQSKRGRPRKLRPDMDGRLEKAQKTRGRALSDSSDSDHAVSGAEDSPSPPAHRDDFQTTDSTKLVDLPEDDEIDNFGLDPSLTHHSPPITTYDMHAATTSTSMDHMYPLSNSGLDYSNLAASPSGSMSPTSPILPSPPPLVANEPHSGSSDMDPPTSPLCASTSTMPEQDTCAPSIFDDLCLHVSSADDSGLSMSFATSEAGLAAFGGVDYLKSDMVSFHDQDDAFKMWAMDGTDY